MTNNQPLTSYKIPQTLEEAIAQAKEATKTALQSGLNVVQIELVIPEIALKAQYLAAEFTSLFADDDSGLKVLFPDTGAAALAKRDWGETSFSVTDLGSSRSPIEMKVNDLDRAFLVISPSAVEVSQVEKLCNLAGDRPVVLVIPQLEDISIVGIGYAARQLRERFLNNLQSSYYFRPLEGAVVWRVFPGLWQVWREKDDDYQLIAEQPTKPQGETLDKILRQVTVGEDNNPDSIAVRQKSGFFSGIKSFLKALNQ
jgi:hypothetical protein